MFSAIPFESADDRARRRLQEIQQQRALEERAGRLLMSVLTPEQRDRYVNKGDFVITGSLGGKYLIENGYSGNVYRLDGNNRTVACYCAHPVMHNDDDSRLPVAAAMVAQVLAITTDEWDFVKVANPL